jgi:hypothetical protein
VKNPDDICIVNAATPPPSGFFVEFTLSEAEGLRMAPLILITVSVNPL